MADEHRLAGVIRRKNEIEQGTEVVVSLGRVQLQVRGSSTAKSRSCWRDKRAPYISKPGRLCRGRPPTHSRTSLLPNLYLLSQRKLSPDPQLRRPPIRSQLWSSAARRCSQASFLKGPNRKTISPTHSYPILHPHIEGKALYFLVVPMIEGINHSLLVIRIPDIGLDYSKFCPLKRRRPYHRRLSYFAWCHLDEKILNLHEVKAYLKAANVTEATGDLY